MGLLSRILDWSIFYSFDRSGYLRHRLAFDPADLHRSMQGSTCLITGSNSGLGFEIALGLAQRGAAIHLLCRHEGRGTLAREEIVAKTGSAEVHLHVIDLSSLASIPAFVERFEAPKIDVLVHNAGALISERSLTEDGLEAVVATHLVGPFLLTRLLVSRLSGGRVVFISSGGMYARRLDVSDMVSLDGPYNGVAAYAKTKRGQVALSALMARALCSARITVNAMHPGWAATPGVERSLPRFWGMMRHRLRTAEEGADTALWLAVAERIEGTTGQFWFDRRSVPAHLVPWTREDEAERRRLWRYCETRSQVEWPFPEPDSGTPEGRTMG